MTAAAVPARVLLIEDDASIAKFIELALEALPDHDPAAPPVELTLARRLAEARPALAAGGWQLVISDLMLPDGSAETLLAEGFALAPAAPPWLVFSAGVQDDRRAALAAHGVSRLLRKPVPLMELLDTISAMLRAGPAPAGAAVPPRADVAAVADVAAAVVAPDPVQQHFGGDRALYESFRSGCLERFADDLAQGEAAMAAGDAPALRRVAHGLKAVLTLIGEPALAAQALALEDAAAACSTAEPLPEGWAPLAQGLSMLRDRR